MAQHDTSQKCQRFIFNSKPLLTTVENISEIVEATFKRVNGGIAKAVLFFTRQAWALPERVIEKGPSL